VPQARRTPLHATSQSGHTAVVGALLAKGANVKAKDNVSIARACALSASRSLARMQNAHGCLYGAYLYIYLSCCPLGRLFGCKA
jgi:hypothetical protein